MKKIIQALKNKYISVGYVDFFIHFVVEIACFWTLANVYGDSLVLWFIPFLYDGLAFVPQGIIGYLYEKKKDINLNLIGLIFLMIAVILMHLNFNLICTIIILTIGNAFCHVACAQDTLRTSEGKMASPAIFVAGGSFGVVVGKLLGKYGYSFWFILFMVLTAIPAAIMSLELRKEVKDKKIPLDKFNYHNDKLNPWVVVFGALFIVTIRGFMGYGIPTSWNKTVVQTILLFSFMGIGKALGGVFIDAFGMKKTAIWSMILSVPFLIFGDSNMYVSLIGVMFFSMTMGVTLGICASVLKKSPGLAFGITTTGLFLGTIPIFFFRITSLLYNSIIIIVFTIICIIVASIIIKDGK